MITKSVSGCMIEEMPLYQRTKKKLLDAQNSILEFEKIIAEKDVAIAEQSNIISKKDKESALLKEEMLSLKG